MPTRSDAERFTTLVFFGTVFLIAWLAWRIVEPFILEIAWAVVFAICLNPLRERLEPRLGPTRTAMVIMAGVLVLIIVPALVVGSIVLIEGQRAAGQVRGQIEVQGGAVGMFHHVWDWARARVPALPEEQVVVTKIGDSVVSVARFVGSRMGSILASIAGLVLSLRKERDAGAVAAVTYGNVLTALMLLPFVRHDLALSGRSAAIRLATPPPKQKPTTPTLPFDSACVSTNGTAATAAATISAGLVLL